MRILFSKYANLYFAVGRKLIEATNNGGSISEQTISEIVGKHGVFDDNYDFINALIGSSNEDNKFHGIHILESLGAKTYRSMISSTPFVLSSAERSALIESLSLDIAPAFVSEQILIKFGVTSNSSELAEKLGTVVTAIKTDQWLVFDNHTPDGKIYAGQHLKPHKIEHSLSSAEYFVSGYSRESARLIKCNLKRLTIHAIEESEAIDTGSALDQKRCSEPIRLCIENQKNAIDRAFNMFSDFEKDGFYDKTNDRYILDIDYYEFEERVLMDKILSLGAAAVVVSPMRVKDKIAERVKQQLLKLT